MLLDPLQSRAVLRTALENRFALPAVNAIPGGHHRRSGGGACL